MHTSVDHSSSSPHTSSCAKMSCCCSAATCRCISCWAAPPPLVAPPTATPCCCSLNWALSRSAASARRLHGSGDGWVHRQHRGRGWQRGSASDGPAPALHPRPVACLEVEVGSGMDEGVPRGGQVKGNGCSSSTRTLQHADLTAPDTHTHTSSPLCPVVPLPPLCVTCPPPPAPQGWLLLLPQLLLLGVRQRPGSAPGPPRQSRCRGGSRVYCRLYRQGRVQQQGGQVQRCRLKLAEADCSPMELMAAVAVVAAVAAVATAAAAPGVDLPLWEPVVC